MLGGGGGDGAGSRAADVGRAGGRREGERRPHRSRRSVARGSSWLRSGGGRRLPRATRVTRTRCPSRRQCCVSSGALGLRYHLAAAAPRRATAVPASPRRGGVLVSWRWAAVPVSEPPPQPYRTSVRRVTPCPRAVFVLPQFVAGGSAWEPRSQRQVAEERPWGVGGGLGTARWAQEGTARGALQRCGSCLWRALRVLQLQLRLGASGCEAVLILPPSPQRKRLNHPRNGRAGRSPGSETTPGLAQLPTLLSVTRLSAAPPQHPKHPRALLRSPHPTSRPQSLPIDRGREAGEPKLWGEVGTGRPRH